MEIAESLKKIILEKFDIFTSKNIAIGSVDPSRFNSTSNYCVIIPETKTITETNLDESFECETKFTISMMFRGAKHSDLIKTMESVADDFNKLLLSDFDLDGNAKDITPGAIKYFYDCGTVEKQSTGLDIELTITSEETF